MPKPRIAEHELTESQRKRQLRNERYRSKQVKHSLPSMTASTLRLIPSSIKEGAHDAQDPGCHSRDNSAIETIESCKTAIQVSQSASRSVASLSLWQECLDVMQQALRPGVLLPRVRGAALAATKALVQLGGLILLIIILAGLVALSVQLSAKFFGAGSDGWWNAIACETVALVFAGMAAIATDRLAAWGARVVSLSLLVGMVAFSWAGLQQEREQSSEGDRLHNSLVTETEDAITRLKSSVAALPTDHVSKRQQFEALLKDERLKLESLVAKKPEIASASVGTASLPLAAPLMLRTAVCLAILLLAETVVVYTDIRLFHRFRNRI